MNILDAYITQRGSLNIAISCIDYKLLKEVGTNISRDLNGKLIDLFDIMKLKKPEDLEINKINSILNEKSSVKVIIGPYYPDNIFDLKIAYHINISLKRQDSINRKIDRSLFEFGYQVKDLIRVNKYLNLANFKSDSEIEDNIFNLIVKLIMKKLDNGKYLDRIAEDNSTEESDVSINTQDEKIFQQMEDEKSDPYSDSKPSKVTVEDINMDNDFEPVNNLKDPEPEMYISAEQVGGIDDYIDSLTESITNNIYNKVMGKRIIKKKMEIRGKRTIKRKLK